MHRFVIPWCTESIFFWSPSPIHLYTAYPGEGHRELDWAGTWWTPWRREALRELARDMCVCRQGLGCWEGMAAQSCKQPTKDTACLDLYVPGRWRYRVIRVYCFVKWQIYETMPSVVDSWSKKWCVLSDPKINLIVVRQQCLDLNSRGGCGAVIITCIERPLFLRISKASNTVETCCQGVDKA